MNGVFLTTSFNGLSPEQLLAQAYDRETRAELETLLTMLPSEQADKADFFFSTWGMPCLSSSEIKRKFPHLKAVFYAAGTVRSFARPFLERGIRVFSAAMVNAIPVAEYVAAQIVLANKGFFQAARRYRINGWSDARAHYDHAPGNYGTAVGILGAGAIGSQVIELLKSYHLRVMVFDPFLSRERSAQLGVEHADLATVFATCSLVSNHLADNEQTLGLLNYSLFSSMPPYAVFLNTGRGAQVVEDDLARALAEEPGRTAVLDVTTDEPVRGDSPLLTLPNAILTPHIAGSSAGEIARMGHFSLENCRALLAGKQPAGEVTLTMLDTMA